ncbi:SDR family NAD(P)-dependent oxidoreductase (plasmid) [Streptomyces sp. R39]|uniref:SDR family NAD(P)-dependent oxidoreductase n=1 Tax=Streptomyces sp. R39 TaxID=3238631 RepID=A0AB39R6E6_9ACTN
MSGKLAGRVAIVVGGGQTEGETIGNGRAACLTYAREGAGVLVVDRDPAAAEQTVTLVREQDGQAHPLQADITSETDCRGIPEAALAAFGRIDILHNNVGIVPGGPTEQLTAQQWRTGFEVNLTGMWLTCKYVLPHLRAQGSGTVINISSMAGLMAGGEAIAYVTSKAAVNSMTRSLALQYAPHGVRVNAIAPGMMDTPMGVDHLARTIGASRDEIAAQRAAAVPMGHQGTSWDVANAALFLASDDAAYITGVVLPIDGGYTLQTGS